MNFGHIKTTEDLLVYVKEQKALCKKHGRRCFDDYDRGEAQGELITLENIEMLLERILKAQR